ncbi:hypothetical protein GCM10009550_73240 [Actinocorallia libanotica]|uniref:Uncharacterized protein n=1 Tax=Actinocorallia libanotica TaxID=46162 RepID=A0ABP4CIQ6_9ACTN
MQALKVAVVRFSPPEAVMVPLREEKGQVTRGYVPIWISMGASATAETGPPTQAAAGDAATATAVTAAAAANAAREMRDMVPRSLQGTSKHARVYGCPMP